MVKSLEFAYNKRFTSFFFRFGQILFNLARMFAAQHEKKLCSLLLLRSLLITYLITLSLEKEIIVLAKKSAKSLEFWVQQICTNPVITHL